MLFDEGRSSLLVEVCPLIEETYFIKDAKGKLKSHEPKSSQDSKESTASQKLAVIAKCNYCQAQGQLGISCHCLRVFYCSADCQTADSPFHEKRCQGLEIIEKWDQACQPSINARMGLTGIRNLNNSCYLSSSLQCLSAMIGLTKYFLSGKFKNEINHHNPLGT